MEVARLWRRNSTPGDAVAVTVRLRVVAAIAKARTLLDNGWSVVIIDPDDVHYPPDAFDRLLSCEDS